MYEKRALRVQKWTVEKKGRTGFWKPPLDHCFLFVTNSLSLTFFYIAENMPIGVGKNAPKYMQQQSELLISNPSLFT